MDMATQSPVANERDHDQNEDFGFSFPPQLAHLPPFLKEHPYYQRMMRQKKKKKKKKTVVSSSSESDTSPIDPFLSLRRMSVDFQLPDVNAGKDPEVVEREAKERAARRAARRKAAEEARTRVDPAEEKRRLAELCELISQVPAFAGDYLAQERGFHIAVVKKLRTVKYAEPGQIIVTQGEHMNKLIYLKRGCGEAKSPDNSRTIAIVDEGSFFGDLQIVNFERRVNRQGRTTGLSDSLIMSEEAKNLTTQPSRITITTDEFGDCECLELHRNDLEEVLRDFMPDIEDAVRDNVRQRAEDIAYTAYRKERVENRVDHVPYVPAPRPNTDTKKWERESSLRVAFKRSEEVVSSESILAKSSEVANPDEGKGLSPRLTLEAQVVNKGHTRTPGTDKGSPKRSPALTWSPKRSPAESGLMASRLSGMPQLSLGKRYSTTSPGPKGDRNSAGSPSKQHVVHLPGFRGDNVDGKNSHSTAMKRIHSPSLGPVERYPSYERESPSKQMAVSAKRREKRATGGVQSQRLRGDLSIEQLLQGEGIEVKLVASPRKSVDSEDSDEDGPPNLDFMFAKEKRGGRRRRRRRREKLRKKRERMEEDQRHSIEDPVNAIGGSKRFPPKLYRTWSQLGGTLSGGIHTLNAEEQAKLAHAKALTTGNKHDTCRLKGVRVTKLKRAPRDLKVIRSVSVFQNRPENLQATMSKYSSFQQWKDIEEFCNKTYTLFSRDQLRELHRVFWKYSQESGVLRRKALKEMMRVNKIFNDTFFKLSERMFAVWSKKLGYVTFENFIIGLDSFQFGTTHSRLQAFVALFDLDGNGMMNKEEMRTIFGALMSRKIPKQYSSREEYLDELVDVAFAHDSSQLGEIHITTMSNRITHDALLSSFFQKHLIHLTLGLEYIDEIGVQRHTVAVETGQYVHGDFRIGPESETESSSDSSCGSTASDVSSNVSSAGGRPRLRRRGSSLQSLQAMAASLNFGGGAESKGSREGSRRDSIEGSPVPPARAAPILHQTLPRGSGPLGVKDYMGRRSSTESASSLASTPIVESAEEEKTHRQSNLRVSSRQSDSSVHTKKVAKSRPLKHRKQPPATHNAKKGKNSQPSYLAPTLNSQSRRRLGLMYRHKNELIQGVWEPPQLAAKQDRPNMPQTMQVTKGKPKIKKMSSREVVDQWKVESDAEKGENSDAIQLSSIISSGEPDPKSTDLAAGEETMPISSQPRDERAIDTCATDDDDDEIYSDTYTGDTSIATRDDDTET